jgi:hypothetical protein
MKKKTCHVLGQLFILTSCKKNCSKIHSYEKKTFGKKDMLSFFPIISLAHYIMFTPIGWNHGQKS